LSKEFPHNVWHHNKAQEEAICRAGKELYEKFMVKETPGNNSQVRSDYSCTYRND
jgi:hypothetical protein